MRRRSLSGVLARLAGVGLAGLAAEGALVFGGIVAARQANPRPHLLTHALAGGTLAIGLGTLGAARRAARCRVSGVGCQTGSRVSGVGCRRLPLPPDTRDLTPAFWALAGGVAGLVGYGFYLEPRWLEQRVVEVGLERLPEGLVGLRIALLSDLHAGPHFGRAEMERVVAATNELRPDLVALLGDYVAQEPTDAAVVAEGVRRLEAPLGIYGVLGNHDYWIDHVQVARRLSAAGTRMLRNAGLPLERGGGRLWLAGVDDLRWGRPDLRAALAGARSGEPIFLLAHNPMLVHTAARRGVDLVLSGHTHGGQVRLPFVGPLLLPIKDRRLGQGLIRFGRTQLYVNRGVGVGTPPARFLARPEVTLVVLRRADSALY